MKRTSDFGLWISIYYWGWNKDPSFVKKLLFVTCFFIGQILEKHAGKFEYPSYIDCKISVDFPFLCIWWRSSEKSWKPLPDILTHVFPRRSVILFPFWVTEYEGKFCGLSLRSIKTENLTRAPLREKQVDSGFRNQWEVSHLLKVCCRVVPNIFRLEE